ncbi:hypothetical protein OAE06_00670, partial [bacterium]|nr:hypothetical protein [bacterium]
GRSSWVTASDESCRSSATPAGIGKARIAGCFAAPDDFFFPFDFDFRLSSSGMNSKSHLGHRTGRPLSFSGTPSFPPQFGQFSFFITLVYLSLASNY